MGSKKHGLGRGLDALIPQNRTQEKKESDVKEVSAVPEEKTIVEKTESEPASKKITPEKPASVKTETISQKSDTSDKVAGIEERTEGNAGKKTEDEQNYTGTFKVRITKVEPDRTQPRKSFDEEGLKKLADSIRQFGILEPLLVQQKEDHYEIIAGERRWRAAKLAGLKEVPVVISDCDEKTKAEIQLIENLQREDINPIEEARAYKRLIEEYSLKQEEVADAVSKSRAAIANAMRLLKLPEKVQDMVADPASGLTTGHARALIGIEDEAAQIEIAEKIVSEELSVRDTEKLVKNYGKEKKTSAKEKDASLEAIYRDLENKLKLSLGTKASIISKGKKGGKLEIEFYDADSLDKILEKLL